MSKGGGGKHGSEAKRVASTRAEAVPRARSIAYPAVPLAPRELTVAGVMSGTSADGIDVSICRVGPADKAEVSGRDVPRWEMLGHRAFPFPKPVREAILAAMDAPAISVAELARLSWRLGSL